MSSHTSSPSSPVSTSSTLTEERSTRTMADVVRKFKTEELIDYLQRQDLNLDKEDLAVFRKRKIDGFAFLEMTKSDFRECGFEIGPAIKLAKFIEDLGQKLRSYSSYKTLDDLKEMLRKNKVNGEDITNINQFTPVFEEIDDNDKAFNHCMDNIILKLSNVETMTDANEATRCEFISAILHASIDIAKRVTTQDIFIVLQKDISGEESTGRVDYAIKGLEDLLCITEGKPRNIKIGYAQNLAQLESAYQTNKKKRTADEAFDNEYFDYLYGIVST
ncbi:5175_t:CDS:2, partial [Paraglomus brasilianum]